MQFDQSPVRPDEGAFERLKRARLRVPADAEFTEHFSRQRTVGFPVIAVRSWIARNTANGRPGSLAAVHTGDHGIGPFRKRHIRLGRNGVTSISLICGCNVINSYKMGRCRARGTVASCRSDGRLPVEICFRHVREPHDAIPYSMPRSSM